MKQEILFVLTCVFFQGTQIVSSQEQISCESQSAVLHECMQDDVHDLTWFEWLQKIGESFFVYIQMSVYKIGMYVFTQNKYKQISLLQEKLAENAAELGYLNKALWYSQESLHNSVHHLTQFEDTIRDMQNSKHATFEAIENVRDQIIQYTQHVQAHIITMTDFAADEKNSGSWQLYEKMLMQYFEKMQQVMQNIDACDDVLCKHDEHYCMSASQKAAFEYCMNSDFDPDQYD